MKKLYSQMTEAELQEEIRLARKELEKAVFASQRAVAERKLFTAQAYLLNPADFGPGLYKVDGVQIPFEVAYIHGIMAWGKLGDETEASYPISMLTRF
ncbi:DUF1811 family protein [Paenibacillus puerhi]|uniref:DUF1811 family protein n=1 Tax=Paenibacillus puerhi TaxID=2692622 RepID=UPI00135BFD11|nr:DUF1811 family protein [Paenibacillus puerhi]